MNKYVKWILLIVLTPILTIMSAVRTVYRVIKIKLTRIILNKLFILQQNFLLLGTVCCKPVLLDKLILENIKSFNYVVNLSNKLKSLNLLDDVDLIFETLEETSKTMDISEANCILISRLYDAAEICHSFSVQKDLISRDLMPGSNQKRLVIKIKKAMDISLKEINDIEKEWNK